jgi:TonB family protein
MMLRVLLLAVLLGMPDRQADPSAELALARSLYASAAYEEGLDRLARVGSSGGLVDQVDTYRALCLLALGRTAESERALEQIVLRNPHYVLAESEVSPRLVVAFQAVRARVLPAAIQSQYAAARANLAANNYAVAADQLRKVLAYLGPAQAPEAGPGFADLRVLAEGFLNLAESMVVTEESRQTVYSIEDRDVIAPVEISRPVPGLQTPKGQRKGLYQGVVEILIDEQGRVASAEIRKSVTADYDAAYLAATAAWRFQPATRNGVTVKYRRAYEIIVYSR